MRPTKMIVSMGTLVENARALRSRVSENVRMLCVVKADAYGHGALPLALKLEAEKIADAFAVAIVEEARQLREGGVRGMIVILGGACEESLREAVAGGVYPGGAGGAGGRGKAPRRARKGPSEGGFRHVAHRRAHDGGA